MEDWNIFKEHMQELLKEIEDIKDNNQKDLIYNNLNQLIYKWYQDLLTIKDIPETATLKDIKENEIIEKSITPYIILMKMFMQKNI